MDKKTITVTKEQWDRALVEAPPHLLKGAKCIDYCRECVVGRALQDAGFNVESVGYYAVRADGKRWKFDKDGSNLVRAFDTAETMLRAGAKLTEPTFPYTFVVTESV